MSFTFIGIAVSIFDEVSKLAVYCNFTSDFLVFNQNSSNEVEFKDKLLAHFNTNTSRNNLSMIGYWFPLFKDYKSLHSLTHPNLKQNLQVMELLSADAIAIITKRVNIEMRYKFFYVSRNLITVLIAILLVAILFSAIVWVVVSF